MSSAKPEVHNVSQRRQRRTEPRPQATCTINLVKFGCVIFDLWTDRQTNKQTNRHAHHNTSQTATPASGDDNYNNCSNRGEKIAF